MNKEQIELFMQIVDQKCYEATMASCAILNCVVNAIGSQPGIDFLKLNQDIIAHLRSTFDAPDSDLMSRCAAQMADIMDTVVQKHQSGLL